MDLQELQNRVTTISDPAERAGLQAFINQVQRLPPEAAIMGKIMQSVLSFGQRDAVNNARTFGELQNAFGPNFNVTVEP